MKTTWPVGAALILCNLPSIALADSRGCYQSQPSLQQALIVLEAGLCKTAVEFLGSPVCNDVRAFRSGTPPMLAVGGFSVGATFRVEQAKNGSIAWSEENPLYALYNVGDTKALDAARLLDVEPDSLAQKQEAERYFTSESAGHPDKTLSLHKYVEAARDKAPRLSLASSPDGMFGAMPCMTVYVRQHDEKIYAVLSTKHETSFEIDAHPVIYFVVFPSRER